MSKTIEDYLSVLYQNPDSLSGEMKKRYLKDREFLTKYISEFNVEYDRYSGVIDEFGEYEFTINVLNLCKERLDKETIILSYVKSISKELAQDSYIHANFEEFLEIMYAEREQAEKSNNVVLDYTPIDINRVFELTEKFLEQIDPSKELLSEFQELNKQGRILVHSADDKNQRSTYKYDCVNFVFDGTVNSAYTLVHEFMHHVVEQRAHPTQEREEHTMLNEFESIYYENAFIDFMDAEGVIKCGRLPLMSKRFKREYERDPDNCILMLLDLCQIMRNGVVLEKESIIPIFKNIFLILIMRMNYGKKEVIY